MEEVLKYLNVEMQKTFLDTFERMTLDTTKLCKAKRKDIVTEYSSLFQGGLEFLCITTTIYAYYHGNFFRRKATIDVDIHYRSVPVDEAIELITNLNKNGQG